MIDVRLTGIKVDTILDIVRELRQVGLVQGQDFDFAYTPEKYKYDLSDSATLVKRHTVFSFYNDGLASWFGIKYAEYLA